LCASGHIPDIANRGQVLISGMAEHDDARVIIATGESTQKTANARPQGGVVDGEQYSLLREHSTLQRAKLPQLAAQSQKKCSKVKTDVHFSDAQYLFL
jgi:hypothetical protein